MILGLLYVVTNDSRWIEQEETVFFKKNFCSSDVYFFLINYGFRIILYLFGVFIIFDHFLNNTKHCVMKRKWMAEISKLLLLLVMMGDAFNVKATFIWLFFLFLPSFWLGAHKHSIQVWFWCMFFFIHPRMCCLSAKRAVNLIFIISVLRLVGEGVWWVCYSGIIISSFFSYRFYFR